MAKINTLLTVTLICIFFVFESSSVAQESNTFGFADVRKFGAKGDGKSDDSEAILKAIASLPEEGGIVYFAPGQYLSGTIPGKSQVTFKGYSGWGYRSDSLGCTVISPINDKLKMLFDLNGSVGTRIVGLTLDGQNKGTNMHGIYSKHAGSEQNIVFDDCRISRFSGSGIRLENVWVFNIRHCLISGNKGAGIDGSSSYDGWILDNQITGNSIGGIYGTSFSTVTITGNRIEWNKQGGIVLGPGACTTLQITACTFDRNSGPGISLVNPGSCFANTFTGNIFRRNGYKQEKNPELFCHLLLKNVSGVVVSGNSFFGGSHNGDAAKNNPASPGYGMILEGLNESVVTGNSLYHSALLEVISDKGGHKNSVIKDNPGSLRKPGLDQTK